MKKILLLNLICIFVLFGCGSKNSIDDKNIIVAASQTPHAEILEQARNYIEEQGYNLEIRVFNDYVIQNEVTASGEVDANFFQHYPYLEDYNLNNNADLVSVLMVHFEPLGLYFGRRDSLDNLDNAKIAIANDNSNGARGLLLLESLDIIELDKNKGLNVTVNDIISNPYKINIIELDAAAIPSQLVDLDFAVINGNYALEASIPNTKLLASEKTDSLAAETYANIIAVKDAYKEKEAIKVLIEALMQVNVSDYIENSYQGLVVSINKRP